jgi:hypothetical protein
MHPDSNNQRRSCWVCFRSLSCRPRVPRWSLVSRNEKKALTLELIHLPQLTVSRLYGIGYSNAMILRRRALEAFATRQMANP